MKRFLADRFPNLAYRYLNVRTYYRQTVRIGRFINFLNREHPEICVSFLDVGARGGLSAIPIFRPLKRLKNRLIHGIEPDTEEAERLRKSGEYDHVFTDGVAWYDGEAVLHVPNPYCASIREINAHIAKPLGLFDRGQYYANIPVHVKKLSSILPKGRTYDFVKVDVEGCDYDVLASADPVLLEKVLCVVCEIQGVQLYKNQKVLADLNALMEERGFFPYSLQTQESGFQLYDAVFIKDPQRITNIATVLKYCLFGMLLCKKSVVVNVLKTYERNHGQSIISKTIYKLI